MNRLNRDRNRQINPDPASTGQERFVRRPPPPPHHRAGCPDPHPDPISVALGDMCGTGASLTLSSLCSPSRIFLCLRDMVADRSIFLHTGVTLYETIASFLLVTAIGILAAVLLWCSRSLSEILEPYLVVLNSLPKSALAPLLIVWLGAAAGHHHRGRHVRGHIRQHHEPVYLLHDR